MYDAAIIGSGPAGLSAALNLKLHNKDIIWFGSRNLSMKVEKSEKIANYPGLPLISGADLNKKFRDQIEKMGLEITDKMVTSIASAGKGFMILGDNDVYEARSVILASGSVSARPMPGEEELLGKGVSYCATCDGFLYKGKTIAVICSAKRYEHEVEYLAELADTLYLYANYEDCRIELPNVIRFETGPKVIQGKDRVESILLRDGLEQKVDGVFILRTSVAPNSLLAGIEMNGPHIRVDRDMRTSVEGVFAAGDCTGRPYQITKAVGEGNIAAHSLIEFL